MPRSCKTRSGPGWRCRLSTCFSGANILYKSLALPTISVDLFPLTDFYLQGALVSWSISGVDGAGCANSGSGSFSVGPHPGAGSDRIRFYSGALAGGPSYRLYDAFGPPDDGQTITYTRTCDGNSATEFEPAGPFLWIPLDRGGSSRTVPPGGHLTGTFKQTDLYGGWTEYQWNLTPGP